MDHSPSTPPPTPSESCCKVDPYRTVTPLSKALAMATFILLPVGTFFLGMQMVLPKVIEVPYPVEVSLAKKSLSTPTSPNASPTLQKIETLPIPKDMMKDHRIDCLKYDCGVEPYFDPKTYDLEESAPQSPTFRPYRSIITKDYSDDREVPQERKKVPNTLSVLSGADIYFFLETDEFNFCDSASKYPPPIKPVERILGNTKWYGVTPLVNGVDTVYDYFRKVDSKCFKVEARIPRIGLSLPVEVSPESIELVESIVQEIRFK